MYLFLYSTLSTIFTLFVPIFLIHHHAKYRYYKWMFPIMMIYFPLLECLNPNEKEMVDRFWDGAFKAALVLPLTAFFIWKKRK
ncbi:hypothetical protein [Solimicrobium silvestre]|uniref:Uncharacterized protein n=1 Tax=Solimicrobium silvestre TaxID=2099400 RepID=A0A2S9H4I9_9BURK|nr:hypothetical protein [Solimicrobium silvestre]PRC94878.1 hypothetical protein S2091_0073 [Solimicrobium silvestre]